MTKTCIGTTILVAGGLFCGGSSPLPAAGVSTVAKLQVSPILGAEGGDLILTQAQIDEAPARIVSDQIRRQGYACDEPRQAERDREASRPNQTVWVLTCGNATYRVTLIPDMDARVERLK